MPCPDENKSHALRVLIEARIAALLHNRNAQQRLTALVEEARRRPALDNSLRTEAHLVPGCLVRTWFVAELRDGRCYFQSDSDAVTLKALLGFLCEVFSGHAPDEIAACDSTLLQRIKVMHQLAENRQRTVQKVAEQLRAFAVTSAASGIAP